MLSSSSKESSSRKELVPFFSVALVAGIVIIGALFCTPTNSALTGWDQSVSQVDAGDYPAVTPVSLQGLLAPGTVAQKKSRFFALLKPMVEIENAYIATQREWLKELDVSQLTEPQQKTLITLLQRYNVINTSHKAYQLPGSSKQKQALVNQLMRHVAPIPIELVLVQAANESAWGRSRFAQQGNNLFGQWCFSQGCGLVPKQRPEGQYHEVAAFRSPQLSIRAYLQNLNGFSAYEKLRVARAQRPDLTGAEQALYLANYLGRYSQRGQAYVDELKAMIKSNKALIESVSAENLQ